MSWLGDVVDSAVSHIVEGTNSAVEHVEATVDQVVTHTKDAVSDPFGYAKTQWDEVWEDIKSEHATVKEEFSWTGAGVGFGLMLIGVPLPIVGPLIFGLDSYKDAFDYARGEQDKDAKEIEELQEELDTLGEEYAEMYDDLFDVFMFFDEIYQIAAANDISRYKKNSIDPVEQELSQKIDDFNERWGELIKLNKDSILGKVIFSGVMIIGGVVVDIENIFDTSLDDSDRWKAALRIIGLIVSIVVLALTWGGEAYSWKMLVSILLFYIALDASYGASGILSAILSLLDLAINDLMSADEIFDKRIGGLDKDSEYHELAIQTTAIAIELTLFFGAITGLFTLAPAGSKQTAPLQYGTRLQNIYGQFVDAIAVYDFFVARAAQEEFEAEVEAAIIKTNERMDKIRRQRMVLQMMDFKYIQNDADDIINNFVLQASSLSAPYLDPEAMIRMNTRYESEPIAQYGFEDILDSGNMAGNDEYYKRILYGI